MSQSIYFETVNDYNQFNNHETLHPLVSVIDFSKAHKRTGSKMYFNLYCIFLKDVKCGDLKYGRATYDYQEGTLVFVSPGQVVDVENKIDKYQPLGHGLVFHPDLIKGTSLGKGISEYGFFGYQTNEALHLSAKEQQMVLEMFADIQFELSRPVDKHSKKVITSNIELFLNHCDRFYDRQFITRENVNKGILEKFEELLNSYFSSEKPNTIGLPSVAYCADELHFSPNYFGDLIKKETGKTAQEYIQNKIIDIAKQRVFNVDKSISQIAYELGFKYPQHFIRLFKQRTGVTPNEFRNLN
ncbi:helix-turn-helix transcriptional regulator [Chryseobacterium sp. D764]|jgi:AraC-like DNA-binding protein|uniref:helix-turn-helix domain-containing protein n=1 Tax=unclassified Chryseobacterium TaxID=2593645 RepID=UPI0009854B0D|nr:MULTISPECIES: helix-turn-helix transcriptional regulator [unclassified Chryseobacterium]QXU50253.1 helix-turn-helix transcriptional regulator [Chryseobacterium sp. D764]CAD0218695.1 Helix-turn-helix protein [Chryseobacterium sp. JV274]